MALAWYGDKLNGIMVYKRLIKMSLPTRLKAKQEAHTMSIATSCKIENCNRIGWPINGKMYFTKGYCRSHYRRYSLGQDPSLPIQKRPRKTPPPHCYAKDGRRSHPLHNIYWGIRTRCYNPKHKSYPSYGLRGIKVYKEWLEPIQGFIKFVEYIELNLGERPSADHTIDRIDNDKGYEPGNLRWASKQLQVINQGLPKNNTTGQKGVYCAKTGEKKWYAQLKFDGKIKGLGSYATIIANNAV